MILPNERILLKAVEAPKTSNTGIILSIESKEPCVGEVIVVGTHVKNPQIKPGVFLLYQPGHPLPIIIEGESYLLLLESNVEAILDKSIINKILI